MFDIDRPLHEASWLITKHILAPYARIKRDQHYRQFRYRKALRTTKTVACCDKSTYSLLGLPVELQHMIFDHVIQPWEFHISTHTDACLGDYLCSVKFGWGSLPDSKFVAVKCEKQLRSMLDLLLLHPNMKPIVWELIAKRYIGVARWSACGDNMDAGATLWRPPKRLAKLLKRRTWRISILGIVPPACVRRVFPASRTQIDYHMLSSETRSIHSRRRAEDVLQGNHDLAIENFADLHLVSLWEKHPGNNERIFYRIVYHTHILSGRKTEVMIAMLPSMQGLFVTSRWKAKRGSLLTFWRRSSDMTAVKVIDMRSCAQEKRSHRLEIVDEYCIMIRTALLLICLVASFFWSDLSWWRYGALFTSCFQIIRLRRLQQQAEQEQLSV